MQGELTGSWGDTINNGLTSLVDAAIAGTVSVAMPDADYTLTTANEAADQARNMFVTLTGTLTATRNVVCPSVSKLYFVTNATTGGQSIVFKTSAGTGITVANGTRVMLYCDGTNVSSAMTVFAGDISGNAGTVTNGVYTTGDQTINGIKTFGSQPLSENGYKLSSTGWAVTEAAGVLYFSVNGVNKAKLDSSGNLIVAGNVTAYGTV